MSPLLMKTIHSLVTIVALLSAFAGLMVMERKVLGWFQYRKGPNRTGPWGLLQPLADGIKLMFKEDIIPRDADRLVFFIAPVISLFVALAAFAVVPIAPGWAVADPNAGMLVMLAISSLAVYGVALAGWASQSKYALLGSLRSTAQMISYELAMGMAVIGVFAWTGSTSFGEIVASQEQGLWNALRQPIGFIVFFVAMFAETSRAPFDLPEAESELVAGYHTEYSGMRFAVFLLAEYIHMITASALITLLYLGGWEGFGFLPPVVWFLFKMLFLIFIFFWVRATLPRIRYDRLMNFGWKVMLPAAALNLVITAVWVAYFGAAA